MSQVANVAMPSLGALVVSEMRLMYGSKFAQQWEGLTPRELRESWDQKLSGVTELEVRQALVACLTRDWPPTLPEFLRLCRPWMDPEVAFQAAVAGMAARRKADTGNWPHPAVYWAAVEIGAHDLQAQGWQALRARWEAIYRAQLARTSWDPIPVPAPALPAPGATVTSNADGMRRVQDLAAQAIQPDRRDPKDWARKILANPKGRAPIAVTMARRALGIDPAEGGA